VSHPETARLLAANYERVSRALGDDPARVREFSELELIEAREWARPLREERGHVFDLCARELATRPPDPRPRVPIGWTPPAPTGRSMTQPPTTPEPCQRCGAAMTAACRPCEREACPVCPCEGCGG